MSYFISDIKKIYKNRMVQLTLLVMVVVAVADPLFVRFVYGKQPEFFEQIGSNPFQFWLLMNSSGWGHTVYRTLFFVFPVLSTGLIFFHEKQSSMYELMVSRKSRIQYLLSKPTAVFITALLNFFLILGLNLIVTNLCFSTEAPLTEQYQYLVPKAGSFAESFYQTSPLSMELIYVILNALTIALLSVLVIGIQMLFRFPNCYAAFLVPFVILYAVNYVEVLVLANKMQYNLSIIIQPRAVSSLSTCITSTDLLLVFVSLIIVDIVVLLIGFKRNRDAL